MFYVRDCCIVCEPVYVFKFNVVGWGVLFSDRDLFNHVSTIDWDYIKVVTLGVFNFGSSRDGARTFDKHLIVGSQLIARLSSITSIWIWVIHFWSLSFNYLWSMETEAHRLVMDDPSEYRPEHKDKTEFRDFRIHAVPDRVKNVSTVSRNFLV